MSKEAGISHCESLPDGVFNHNCQISWGILAIFVKNSNGRGLYLEEGEMGALGFEKTL